MDYTLITGCARIPAERFEEAQERLNLLFQEFASLWGVRDLVSCVTRVECESSAAEESRDREWAEAERQGLLRPAARGKIVTPPPHPNMRFH